MAGWRPGGGAPALRGHLPHVHEPSPHSRPSRRWSPPTSAEVTQRAHTRRELPGGGWCGACQAVGSLHGPQGGEPEGAQEGPDPSVARSFAVVGWTRHLLQLSGGTILVADGVHGAEPDDPSELRRIREALQRQADDAGLGSGRSSRALSAVPGLDEVPPSSTSSVVPSGQHDHLDREVRVGAAREPDQLEDRAQRLVEEREGHRRMLVESAAWRERPGQVHGWLSRHRKITDAALAHELAVHRGHRVSASHELSSSRSEPAPFSA